MDDAATLATRGLCFALISLNLTPNACAILCAIGASLQSFMPTIQYSDGLQIFWFLFSVNGGSNGGGEYNGGWGGPYKAWTGWSGSG
uniref:Uncharacterized protein n=1 Tax=Caenorhabditis japonica TaxID=281687 RepID=A0A8R1IVT6_CAEJA